MMAVVVAAVVVENIAVVADHAVVVVEVAVKVAAKSFVVVVVAVEVAAKRSPRIYREFWGFKSQRRIRPARSPKQASVTPDS